MFKAARKGRREINGYRPATMSLILMSRLVVTLLVISSLPCLAALHRSFVFLVAQHPCLVSAQPTCQQGSMKTVPWLL